jgi:hypothetical protein
MLAPGRRSEEVLVLRGRARGGPRPEAEADAWGRRRAARMHLVR